MENKELSVWFIAGILLTLGVGVGGMAHKSSLSFFDLTFSGAHGPFSFSMPVVFVFGLFPLVLLHQVFKLQKKPVFGLQFQLSKLTNFSNTIIDWQLWGGSLMFGAGWAIGGFCPAPVLAGLVTGLPSYVFVTEGLLLGFVAQSFGARSTKSLDNWGLSVLVLMIPILFFFVGPLLFPIHDIPRVLSWSLYLSALGGACIGCAAVLLLTMTGRTLGVSTIIKRLVVPDNTNKLPEVVFALGCLVGGIILYFAYPQAIIDPAHASRPWYALVLGGFLVGVGTGLANGCTSGHGLNGLSRLSVRSFVATACFMLGNAVTLTLANTLIPHVI